VTIRQRAATSMAGLFTDSGNTMLYEGGFEGSWETALAKVPEALLVGAEADPVTSLGQVRDYWSRAGLLRPAIAATKAVLRLRVSEHGNEHPAAIVEFSMLGVLALRGGRAAEARQILLKAWQQIRSSSESDGIRAAEVASHLGKYYVSMKQFNEAEGVLRQAFQMRHAVAPKTCGLLASQLAEVLLVLAKVDEALPLLRDAWHYALDDFGTDDPRTVARARTLANVLRKLKLFREAAPVLREVYNYVKRNGNDEQAAIAGYELGVALHHTHKREEGLRRVEEAVRWTRSAGTMIEPHGALPSRLTTFATMVIERGRVDEAEGLLLEALEAEKNVFGEDSREVAGRYAMLGYFYERTGRVHEALGWLDVSASLFRTAEGDKSPKTIQVVETQVRLLTEQAKTANEAQDSSLFRELLARASRLGGPVLGPQHPSMLEVRKLRS
jgi:tetratricopeptide (TPR) repeat protein